MKIIKVSRFFLILSALFLTGCASGIDLSQKTAEKFFISIECNDEVSGTGFPIGPDLVMTAKHVGCNHTDIPSISLDNGKTWKVEKKWTFNADSDVAIIQTNEVMFDRWAVLRDPLLGEKVSGFGLAYGGILSFGIISQVEEEHFFSTAIPISGMSGSALVGEDGDVVGIVIHGAPDSYVGGTLSGGYPGGFLDMLKRSYLTYKKDKFWQDR